jgi:hypothetical protein
VETHHLPLFKSTYTRVIAFYMHSNRRFAYCGACNIMCYITAFMREINMINECIYGYVDSISKQKNCGFRKILFRIIPNDEKRTIFLASWNLVRILPT